VNTKCKGDQFENATEAMKEINQTQIQQLKLHQSLQKKYNSNEKTITQKEGKKHTKARLGNSLKKWDSQVMHGHYIRSIDT
jgi:hypothetical protein